MTLSDNMKQKPGTSYTRTGPFYGRSRSMEVALLEYSDRRGCPSRPDTLGWSRSCPVSAIHKCRQLRSASLRERRFQKLSGKE